MNFYAFASENPWLTLGLAMVASGAVCGVADRMAYVVRVWRKP